MADNKSKTTTKVLDREDDLQIEDNFESPPEELDESGPTQRKDKRRISSSSSTKSKEETRKRTKLGLVEENEENISD